MTATTFSEQFTAQEYAQILKDNAKREKAAKKARIELLVSKIERELSCSIETGLKILAVLVKNGTIDKGYLDLRDKEQKMRLINIFEALAWDVKFFALQNAKETVYQSNR